MRLEGISAAVTGGASGLGLATTQKMIKAGAKVTIVDLPTSQGAEVAKDLGDAARFVAADITDEQQFAAALDAADEVGPLRALVHCAGRGARIRLVEKDGQPGALEPFEDVSAWARRRRWWTPARSVPGMSRRRGSAPVASSSLS
jgi:NAD(P)-dependent dehydrogenase (short-subunit alcohol dehydrogenase family)